MSTKKKATKELGLVEVEAESVVSDVAETPCCESGCEACEPSLLEEKSVNVEAAPDLKNDIEKPKLPVVQGDVSLTGPTTDKIGQIVSQKPGNARRYYKRLRSYH